MNQENKTLKQRYKETEELKWSAKYFLIDSNEARNGEAEKKRKVRRERRKQITNSNWMGLKSKQMNECYIVIVL